MQNGSKVLWMGGGKEMIDTAGNEQRNIIPCQCGLTGGCLLCNPFINPINYPRLFDAWLFCLVNEDYESRCKMVAEFYGLEEEKK